MAYNKSKNVEAAQKLLNQGKVPQAIAEYQQILKYEPRDQVTLMTIGELYIRQGETFQAIDYFERLAQIFVGDGFLTKAIAVYKRIAKLAPEEIRPLEKLADLYVQQGVMSEARPLFLQLAEIHLKNNRQPEAVGLLKKLLLAEPDNLRIQIRLADLYQAMGQTREAIETYVSASQRALARGDQSECEKLADKALKLEPNNLAAIIVKARSCSLQGNLAQAAQILENVPDLEKGGEQAELLLDLYIKTLNWDKATGLAQRIYDADEKNFGQTQKVIEALLQSDQGDKALAILDRTHIPMIDAGEHEIVGRLLNDLAARMPDRIEPRELLVDTYGRTSDSFRLPDALANLGDVLVVNNQLDRAKEVFEQLVDREPESESAKRKLNTLLRKMGLLAPEAPQIVPEEALQTHLPEPEAPKVRPGLPSAAPEPAPAIPLVHEAPLDEETQRFIAQSLTDVDLFASYGLTQKAIGLLEAILRRAPRHTPTLEKLLDFVLGAGDDRRTAELAAQLEQIHTDRGDQRGAERFGELRRRFQRAAGLTDEEVTASAQPFVPPVAVVEPAFEEFSIAESSFPAAATIAGSAPIVPTTDHSEVSASQPAAAQDGVQEVDLSDEWASLLADTRTPHPPARSADPDSPSNAVPQAPLTPPLTDLQGVNQDFRIEALHKPKPQPEPPKPLITGDEPDFFTPVPQKPAIVPPPHIPAYAEFELDSIDLPEPATHSAAESPDAPQPSSHAPAAETAPFHIDENVFAELSGQIAEDAKESPAFSLEDEHEIAAHSLNEFQVAPAAPEESTDLHSEIFEPDAISALHDAPSPVSADPKHHHEPPLSPKSSEPEFELDQDFDLILDPEPLVPTYDQAPPEHPIAVPPAEDAPIKAPAFASDQFLADLASEMGDLGIDSLTPSFSNSNHVQDSAPERKPAAPVGNSGPLQEVFDEFRAELGEMGAEEEDLETHYNLGIAFREMGLLEEAISEFQKVAKATDNGRPFRYTMQCCTLLGLAFMDKQQPSIAAIWYERALLTPGVDSESTVALRYDLGVAQEAAGESGAALKSFSQVYAVNIDYRDVAERISALQKPSR